MSLEGAPDHNRSGILPPPDLTERFLNAQFFFDYIFYNTNTDTYDINRFLEMSEEDQYQLNAEMHDEAAQHSDSLERHTYISTCWSLLGQYFARLASKDGLTGLFNKIAFEDAMNDTILQLGSRRRVDGERRGTSVIDKSACLVNIDLDRFKPFNDILGHGTGDQAIVAAANLLKDFTRPSDYSGRLGGDEFSLLLIDVDEDEAQNILARLQQDFEFLSVPYSLNDQITLSDEALQKIGKDKKDEWVAGDLTDKEYAILGLSVKRTDENLEVSVDASFGTAMFSDGLSAQEIEAEADRSMYQFKNDNRENFPHYMR